MSKRETQIKAATAMRRAAELAVAAAIEKHDVSLDGGGKAGINFLAHGCIRAIRKLPFSGDRA